MVPSVIVIVTSLTRKAQSSDVYSILISTKKRFVDLFGFSSFAIFDVAIRKMDKGDVNVL